MSAVQTFGKKKVSHMSILDREDAEEEEEEGLSRETERTMLI
jgi:hypothetical protein